MNQNLIKQLPYGFSYCAMWTIGFVSAEISMFVKMWIQMETVFFFDAFIKTFVNLIGSVAVFVVLYGIDKDKIKSNME